MTIKQYQEISILETGATFDENVCRILNIKLDQTIFKIKEEIANAFKITNTKEKKKQKLNGKWYIAEDDLLECTYEQFVELDRIMAEDDNVKNLHRLLAIYFRPRTFSMKKFKFVPEKFDMNKQETISNYIRDYMDIGDANSLIFFFYLSATKCSKYINISYLNQMK